MTIPAYSERYYLHEFCWKYHRMGTKAEKKCYDKEKKEKENQEATKS